MSATLPHLLLLGGTEEAYELAEALVGRAGLRVTTSLAGATTNPRQPAGSHRIGGFGGTDGLAAWLADEKVALVLDASHPFASRITAQARAAAAMAGIPYLRLERPPWRTGPGDDWRFAADLDAGLMTLAPKARRVFAAVGARALDRLAVAPMSFVVRGVDSPTCLPVNVTFVVGRGPFDLVAERQLFEAERIDAVLCRNSGGQGARAKLDAARELGLPVVMIERSAAPAPGAVADVAAALATLDQLFFGRSTWV
jgi:precorrin-6A/cobalt-precorrin-6A reductase